MHAARRVGHPPDDLEVARLSLQLRLMAKSRLTLPEMIAKVEKEQAGKVIHIRPDLVGDKPQFFVIL